jgi:hypothetical protein
MADTVFNRGKYRMFAALAATADLRMLVILGTTTGVDNPDLDTVAGLDAVSGVSIHSERIALTGETATENDTSDRAELDTANVSFAGAPGVFAMGVAIYDEGDGTDAGRDLVSVHTTGFGVSGKPMEGGLNVNVADLIRGS